MKKQLPTIITALLLTCGCTHHSPLPALHPPLPMSGDLLFYRNTDGSDMGDAISESTGRYVHVAMVERDSTGTLWIIDASPEDGVQRRQMECSDTSCQVDTYRLNMPFDTAGTLARARGFVGLPYDDAFLPDNGALYCSELIYESFLDSNGNHLFEAKPMNWRDGDGRMPEYWERHFGKLRMAVPEGVPGTNPTDLSHSPLLKQLLQPHNK